MNEEKSLVLDFIDGNHIYHAEEGKRLLVDGRESDELVVYIKDLGYMYRIEGINRNGPIMCVTYDQVNVS